VLLATCFFSDEPDELRVRAHAGLAGGSPAAALAAARSARGGGIAGGGGADELLVTGSATVEVCFFCRAGLAGALSFLVEVPDDPVFTHDGFDGGSVEALAGRTVPVGFHGVFGVATISDDVLFVVVLDGGFHFGVATFSDDAVFTHEGLDGCSGAALLAVPAGGFHFGVATFSVDVLLTHGGLDGWSVAGDGWPPPFFAFRRAISACISFMRSPTRSDVAA